MTLGSIRTFLDSLQGLSFIEIHWIFKDIATRFMLYKQQWINFGLHQDLLQHFWILSKVSQRYIGFSRILQRGSCFINSNSGLQELLPVSFGLVATFLDSIQGFIEIHWIFKDIATRFMLHKQQWTLGITSGFIGTCRYISGLNPRFHRDWIFKDRKYHALSSECDEVICSVVCRSMKKQHSKKTSQKKNV